MAAAAPTKTERRPNRYRHLGSICRGANELAVQRPLRRIRNNGAITVTTSSGEFR
jgi:hypothetical protein